PALLPVGLVGGPAVVGPGDFDPGCAVERDLDAVLADEGRLALLTGGAGLVAAEPDAGDPLGLREGDRQGRAPGDPAGAEPAVDGQLGAVGSGEVLGDAAPAVGPAAVGGQRDVAGR